MSNRIWLCVSIIPGAMMPWVSTIVAIAAAGDAAHDAAAHVMVLPPTSTSPANAVSGVTIIPLSNS